MKENASPQAKVVLVTGATSGIGLATALHLAKRGHRVFASGRSEAKIQRLLTAASEIGVSVHPITMDVTDAASIEHARNTILTVTDGHGLDGLVNNAGYGEAGALEEIPLDRLRKQFETNVIGLVGVTQAFLPEMRSRHSGRVINISSVVGKLTTPLMSAYSASKHAVEALSDGMRMELAEAGVQVVIVAPGSIESDFGSTLTDTLSDWVSEGSPYRAHYHRWANMRMMNGAGRSPFIIAKAVEEALELSNPRPRYAITIESKLAPPLVAVLPKRFLDFILRKAMM